MTVELEGSEVTVLSVLLGVTVLSVLTVPLAVGVSLLLFAGTVLPLSALSVLFAGTVLSLSALSFSRFPLNLNANRVLCFFMMI